MGLQEMLNRNCTQPAVYWGNPVDNEFTEKTFDVPVEILCRWQDKEQVLGQTDETQVISRAVVYALQDLDYDGLLWLGELSSLTTLQKANPRDITGICIIKRFEKSPELGSTTRFVRKAFLTPWLT